MHCRYEARRGGKRMIILDDNNDDKEELHIEYNFSIAKL